MRRDIAIATVSTLIVGLIFFLADQTEEKIKADRMIAIDMLACLSAKHDKSQITTDTLSHQCQVVIDQIEHPSNTQMIAYNRKWRIRIAFEQMKANNQTSWVCKGTPENLFPQQCR